MDAMRTLAVMGGATLLLVGVLYVGATWHRERIPSQERSPEQWASAMIAAQVHADRLVAEGKPDRAAYVYHVAAENAEKAGLEPNAAHYRLLAAQQASLASKRADRAGKSP